MSFLTPMLLAGAALVAVPIVLHLVTKRQPVRMLFPAMRLLKKRRQRNESRLRLRRWLLLALRCAAVALLALALARPVLRPQSNSLETGEAADDGPVGEGLALGLVFDNAPNADYRSANETRLQAAQETAKWLLKRASDDTKVITADRSAGARAAEGDPASATLRVDRLAIATATRSIGVAARDALARLSDTPAARRELYVFTDLSEGAWNDDTLRTLAETLDARPGATLRLVDIGAPAPRNLALGEITLSGERLAAGEPLRVAAPLLAVGPTPADVQVELWLQSGDQPAEKRAERRVSLSNENDKPTEVAFTLTGLEQGYYHGSLRVLSGDAAPRDDTRHFAFEVRTPPEILLAANRPGDALFVREALDPSAPQPGVAPRFDTTVARFDRLDRAALPDAVLLLDPAPLDDAQWRRLADYASAGGAVAVFLGKNAALDALNQPAAQTLLPATLRWRSRDETYLRPTRYTHPAIAPLADYAEALPWTAFPVFQRWELAGVRDGAAVVATFADGSPAILDAPLGRGRVLLMTTPLSDRLDEPEPWNLLPTGEDPWPFFLLVDALASHLTGWQSAPLNHRAGETVVVPLPRSLEIGGAELPGVVVRTPRGEAVRQSVPPGATELTIGLADEPGGYRVTAGGGRLDRAFAVNADPDAGRLARIPFATIEEALGEGRVTLVSDREELARTIDLGRVGRELYGWVLALVAAAWGAEQIVSNRFYRAPAGETEA